ncbi:MAG: AIR synthase family protein [Promethearchaeota archaeon]
MNSKKINLETGKLKHEFLEKLIAEHVKDLELNDERVILGSKVGEDAAVIDMGDKYLVAKTDPITFATDEIGYYVVNINVNDVACMGAIPKWFQSTILLPEKDTNEFLIKKIFKDIHDTCKAFNISVVGGHTEITTDLTKPIVVGSLLGEVKKEDLVTSSGAEEGDALILTKGIFIEGTSIIARDKEVLLKKKGFQEEFIAKCKNYLFVPGISIFKEARLAHQNFKIKAFHDPTEGGVACGIAELARASRVGVLVEEEKIHVLPEPLELSKAFNLNPLNTISSGSLLIAISEEEASPLIELLTNHDTLACKIGTFISENKGLLIKNSHGNINALNYAEIDDILKIY